MYVVETVRAEQVVMVGEFGASKERLGKGTRIKEGLDKR